MYMLAKGFSIIYKPNTKENNTQQEISFIFKKIGNQGQSQKLHLYKGGTKWNKVVKYLCEKVQVNILNVILTKAWFVLILIFYRIFTELSCN